MVPLNGKISCSTDGATCWTGRNQKWNNASVRKCQTLFRRLDGHITHVEPLPSVTEAEAPEKAKQWLDGHDLKIWEVPTGCGAWYESPVPNATNSVLLFTHQWSLAMPTDNDQTDQDKEGKHREQNAMQKSAPNPGHYPPQKIEQNDGRTDQSKQSEGSQSEHEKN
jgi:hypothetical protein